MSTEEKANAYDNALNKAKQLLSKCKRVSDKASMIYRAEDIESMFPELKESEDERIRKEIKQHFLHLDDSFPDKAKWLDWLEKKNEQKPYSQREKCINCQFAFTGYCNGTCILKNKVEPKFKNGQWIVWKDKCYKVNYNGCGYELVDQNGLSISSEYGTIDENAHLWTINDAKDGDVLACNEETLLFKSYSVQGRISLYCWYNGHTNNFHSKEVVDISLTTRNKVCPATKEQCNLLFRKIKEAGFKWNKNKKVLKRL